MASPLDPTTWWPWSTRPAAEQGWLDSWLELTTWWVQPARSLADRSFSTDPTTILIELVEGVARRFETQRFEAVVRSTPVSGTLVALRLIRSEAIDARLELRDLTIADLGIETLAAAVPAVGMQVTGEVRLSASPSVVRLRIGVAELIRWLGPRMPSGWTATVDADGTVWARPSGRALDLRLEPAVRADGAVDLVVRAVRRHGRVFRLPAWLSPIRTIRPDLPKDVHLVGGFRAGASVEVELEVPALDEHLDLGQLRDAIARRQVLAFGA